MSWHEIWVAFMVALGWMGLDSGLGWETGILKMIVVNFHSTIHQWHAGASLTLTAPNIISF
jgi:hypothetical protein